MFKKYLSSIKVRIITLTLTYTLIISILMVSIFFYIFQSFLYKNLIRSSEFNLQLISDNISNDMNKLIYFSRWCCTDSTLNSYLSSDDENKEMSFNAFDRLTEEYRNCRSKEFIERVIISKNDGTFLQVVSSVYSGRMNASEIIKKSDFFDTLIDYDGFYWIGVKDNPLASAGNKNTNIIPIIRPIYDEYGTEIVGWVYLGISTKIITNYLKEYNLPADSELFLTIGDNSYLVTYDSITPLNTNYTIKQQLNHVAHNTDTIVTVVTSPTLPKKTIVSCPTTLKGWYLSQSISNAEFFKQKEFYHFVVYMIFVLLFGLGIALIFYFNRTINKPITKIRNKLVAISTGDFTYDSSIEWNHELGDIGKGINLLSENISQLMDKRIEDEKQQKDLEYQILLSQINPHFLYNTLNSIKWMATIQNATGIAEMTTSLARLMKNISKGTTQLITIEEELSLLKDYFVIQQYRYGGGISLDYDIDEDVYDCMILCFTLQPLVENALFHGIEPKGEPGKISIQITTNHSKQIDIIILDDGIGMTKEQITNSLSDQSDTTTSDFFKKIGINNVNRRLKYEFGEMYGITITSSLGEYTKMHITLPYLTSKRS
ncbi:MAG: sensor histidine kinase [Lachnotalea sp.]